MTGVLFAVYGFLAFVSLLNLILLRRPGRMARGEGAPGLCALIPARNEAENLRRLLPLLREQVDQVIVYDDGSTDGTSAVAREFGATVVTGGDLPPGWTGKNHACHRLAQIAAETSPAEWWVFLDADVEPGPHFGDACRSLAADSGRWAPVISGFTQFRPGRGLEPLYLLWVPWLLLASCPFGLISRSRQSHARFTNGQFVMWRGTRYTELWPHEANRAEVLEDVQIGRWLARNKVPVEVVDISGHLAVHMYRDLKSAWHGMGKNSAFIFPSAQAAMGFSLICLGLAVAGIASPLPVLLLILSGLSVALTVRSFTWAWLFTPLVLLTIPATLIHAYQRLNAGTIEWKGRIYGTSKEDNGATGSTDDPA